MNYKAGFGISLAILIASILADALYNLPSAYKLFVLLVIFPLTLLFMGYAYMSPIREEEEMPFIGY